MTVGQRLRQALSERLVLIAGIAMLALAGSSASALTSEEKQELAQRIASGARPQILQLNDVVIEDYKRPSDIADSDRQAHEFLVIRARWEETIELADHAFAMRTLQVGGGPGPNAIYVGSSGGARCCYTGHLIWIEGRVRHQEIPLGPSDLKIEARNGPPRLRFSDTDFARGEVPSAAAYAAPEVVLAYDPRRGEYGLDADAMLKPPPSDATLADQAAEIREKGEASGERLDPALSAAMIDLIYAGNAGSARVLLDTAWPEAKPGKEAFLADFTRRLWAGETWRRFALGRLLGAEQAFPRPAAGP
jgi:hypothetical protein